MILLQINPVVRVNTSTGRIMQEIGDVAMAHGWESYVAYSGGRDGIRPSTSQLMPVGGKLSVAWHGVMTRLLDRHGLASVWATRRFVKQIAALKPDVIHIHNVHGYFLNYKILFRYLKRSGIPVVWTLHDCWLYTGHCYHYVYAGCDRWKTGCHHCPQRKEFPKSYVVDRSARNWRDKRRAFTSLAPGQLTLVPVSAWLQGEVRQSFLQQIPSRVIHNGIDLTVFAPQDDRAVREQYGLGSRKILLGVASIWSDEKGFSDFIALSALLHTDEVLVMVGVKDEERKRLPAGVVAISRTENIRQLAALYSAATAFVNLTYQDNYPTVNLEAIACGTPVVTYRTGGSIEPITPETGIIVEQHDIEGVLAAVREIAAKGKDHYTQQCRHFATQNFAKSERYFEYIGLYRELLGGD